MEAYRLLEELRSGNKITRNPREAFLSVQDTLGYGLLLKRYTDNVVDATPEQIRMAAEDTIPDRVAAVLLLPDYGGLPELIMLLVFATAFYKTARRTEYKSRQVS